MRVLFLCRFSMMADRECAELTFVQYIEHVPPLDTVDDILGCVCLESTRTRGGARESEVGVSVEVKGCSLAEG